MKFFADTASLEEIEYCFSQGVNDGITTNPKIMENTGDLSLGFEQACKNLLRKYPLSPVSLETDLRGIKIEDLNTSTQKAEEVSRVLLKQAYELSSWQNNVIIKIPICSGGLLATKILSEKNIKTNVTACMTPYQALEAAKAGATYVSLFANRMLDSHILVLSGNSLEKTLRESDWKDKVKEAREQYFEEAWDKTIAQIAFVASNLDNKDSALIIGSIRSPEDILRIVRAQPQVITIPTKIVQGLKQIPELKLIKRTVETNNVEIGYSLYHPMTSFTLQEFEDSANIYRKV